MTARIVLLVTSPRLPAGLLTAAAWDLLRAHPVYAADDSEQAVALRAAGVEVTEEPLEGHVRVYVADPFGNRIELLEPTG